MALVGRVETRFMSTTSRATYRVLVVRCLLCGKKLTHNVSRSYVPADGGRIVADCYCYDDALGGPHQPVRIIPND